MLPQRATGGRPSEFQEARSWRNVRAKPFLATMSGHACPRTKSGSGSKLGFAANRARMRYIDFDMLTEELPFGSIIVQDFAGDFEVHITVALTTPAGISDLHAWAEREGMKCLHIVLDRGEHISQPMLSYRRSGHFFEQLTFAKRTCERLTPPNRVCSTPA